VTFSRPDIKPRPRSAVQPAPAGVLLAAAALTKQTGPAEGVVVGAVLLAGPRRRLACVALFAEFTVLGVSTLVLGLTSGGWYVYYVFQLMGGHSLNAGGFGWFWTALLSSMGIAASADRAVGERLVAGMRAIGGTVAVPADPGLNVLAGMAPTAHQDAAYDVLRATDPAAIASFTRSAASTVAARRFSAIITDGPGVPLGYPPSLGRYYRQCPQPLLAGVPAALFLPVAGANVRPAYVWLPRGGASCAAAVGALDGTAP
jgi:hypothetical protein